MLEKSRQRIKSSLEATSAKLRERSQEKADCDHEIYNLRKQNKFLNKSLEESNQKISDLNCAYETSCMGLEDLLGCTSSAMRNVEEAKILQNKNWSKPRKRSRRRKCVIIKLMSR